MIGVTYFEELKYTNPSIIVDYNSMGVNFKFNPYGDLMCGQKWVRFIESIKNNQKCKLYSGDNSSIKITYDNSLVCFQLAAYGGDAGGTFTISIALTSELLDIFQVVSKILSNSDNNKLYIHDKTSSVKVTITFDD